MNSWRSVLFAFLPMEQAGRGACLALRPALFLDVPCTLSTTSIISQGLTCPLVATACKKTLQSAKVVRERDEKPDFVMAKATWNGRVIAESDTYETVEGNIYFPDSAIRREYFRPSSTISTCPWKGQARYYSLLVDGQENQDAAWYYPDPKPAARNIKNHVAFWRGVEIEK